MIIYFSGTGNSRWCAQFLAEQLQDEAIDAFNFIHDGIAADLLSVRPWVFVCPTYAWQIPHIFRDFIKSGNFSGNQEAYFIMTCGSDIGNAPEKNQLLCHEKGLAYQGTLEVIMPENYVAMFPVPNQEKSQEIMDAARPVLGNAVSLIKRDHPLPDYKSNFLDSVKTRIINPSFYKIIVKASPFIVSDSCIGCGKCVEGCVLSNIQLKNGKPVWGKNCTHCMACICGCPMGAIEYGSKSIGKERYQCPEYKK